MKISDKLYDILKWVSIICLPALSTFYLLIAQIWKLPLGNEIAQTITGVATLVGALIGISTINYQKDKDKE